ncbi:NAD(P)-binding protein [Hypoxylon trugodes]|uniref:NAD(P)-binding protein n=1 Tax=Hypoxylon trugodes TaxID=326681 RepID=UPI00219BA83C|nr:NAD(P)-binding protein [Hypoxylon trugodes]KAI1388871.1 NAD(P)-binding protein [Hypoxylon trugodes]
MPPPLSKLIYQGYMKLFPIPLPPPGSFKDQIAVVTGGTSGLGLATAVHFINLGATEVIITSRDSTRANAALATIEKETGGKSKGRIRVLDLDMNRYVSVVAFVKELKKVRQGGGGVDHIVLNAGLAGVDFKIADEGWEQNVQANALSTALLAILLLPWLKAERANRSSPAHLAIVGSSRHQDVNIEDWKKWEAETGILNHYNKPENWTSPDDMYAATKLMVHYAIDELVKMALGPDKRPQVVINTMCPGLVSTNLARYHKAKGAVIAVVAGIFMGLFGKSPENGARTYLAACLTKEEEHGKFIRFYGTEAEYWKLEEIVLTGEVGRKLQAQVWSEMKNEFVAKVPEARKVLGV